MHFGGRDQMNGFQLRPYGDLRHGLGHQAEPLSMFPGYANAASAAVTEIPESLLSDVVIAREAAAFLQEHLDAEPETPFFLCASFTRPHCPLTAPGRYIRRYRDAVEPPPHASTFTEYLEPYARATQDAAGFRDLSDEQIARAVEAYYACVDFVDDCIGELLRAARECGGMENTVVIYTTDHGEMLGRHGLWGKAVYYDEAVRVPLLISGPGVASGAHAVRHPISLMDLFPTTCALADLPIPDGLDGVDCSALLADPGGAEPPRAFAPSAYFKYGVRVDHFLSKNTREPGAHRAMRLLRDARWKYVDIEEGEPLLFDLSSDPGETINLAGQAEHAERRGRMHAELSGGIDWPGLRAQLAEDRARVPEYFSGLQPSTPNQYRLPDGRVFDAEASLYGARWLHIPEGSTGGIIPQMFG
jgi:choline-sulfatase